MSEKVYGFSGANKCRKEVIPKEEQLQKEKFILYGRLFDGYEYTKENIFNYAIPAYTVDMVLYTNQGKYTPIPLENSVEEVKQSSSICACYAATGKVGAQKAKLTIRISPALMDTLNAHNSNYIVVICQEY